MQEAYAQVHGRLPQAFMDDMLSLLEQGLPRHSTLSKDDPSREAPSREGFSQRKTLLADKHRLGFVPSDIMILTHLNDAQFARYKGLLLTKPVRTGSGVTVVAVMTKPLPCPHGKCTYCPGGPGSHFGDVPQSYTGHEPATKRGIRAGYDAYVQVFNRLEQYVVTGHNPEKVELILMGGTFPSYGREYQDEVVHDVFQAMDDFSRLFYPGGHFEFSAFKEFYLLPGSVHDKERAAKLQARILAEKTASPLFALNIGELQARNEDAAIRCVGLTIETRPSHARLREANLMLEQGCTRVELGVQTTFDDVLEKVHRDHTMQDTLGAIADLRDLGFKLNFHIMLGLPLMTPERDIEAAHRLFDDSGLRPDMLKIYPCMVMPGTPLYHDFRRGSYTPYSTAQAADVIAGIKRFVPPYVRIMRIQRDIPTNVTTAGVGRTNLRQVVEERCKTEGIACRCIRCREVGQRAGTGAGNIALNGADSRSASVGMIALNILEYDASGGKEFFISADEPSDAAFAGVSGAGRLLGFCRMRFPARCLRPEITPNTAIVRELHVYGAATGIGEEGDVQHRGLGRRLMEEAERVARAGGRTRMLVISGVGVRGYYRRLGYGTMGLYMGKGL